MKCGGSGATWGCRKKFCNGSLFPGRVWRCAFSAKSRRSAWRCCRKPTTLSSAEIKAAGLYSTIWQSFAVLLPVMSVGVMGDQRTYAYTCAVRAVHSEDGMTADWVPLPHEVLKTHLQPHRE